MNFFEQLIGLALSEEGLKRKGYGRIVNVYTEMPFDAYTKCILACKYRWDGLWVRGGIKGGEIDKDELSEISWIFCTYTHLIEFHIFHVHVTLLQVGDELLDLHNYLGAVSG